MKYENLGTFVLMHLIVKNDKKTGKTLVHEFNLISSQPSPGQNYIHPIQHSCRYNNSSKTLESTGHSGNLTGG